MLIFYDFRLQINFDFDFLTVLLILQQKIGFEVVSITWACFYDGTLHDINVNPLVTNGLSHPYHLDESI